MYFFRLFICVGEKKNPSFLFPVFSIFSPCVFSFAAIKWIHVELLFLAMTNDQSIFSYVLKWKRFACINCILNVIERKHWIYWFFFPVNVFYFLKNHFIYFCKFRIPLKNYPIYLSQYNLFIHLFYYFNIKKIDTQFVTSFNLLRECNKFFWKLYKFTLLCKYIF